MILGRSPILWYALLGAFTNALILFGVIHLADAQLAGLDGLYLAMLGVIANERDPLAVGTLAATVHGPATVPSASSTDTASLPTATAMPTSTLPSVVNVIEPALAQAVVALIDRLTSTATTPTSQPAPVATVPVPAVVADPAPPVETPLTVAPALPAADENHAG